jgi:hypothetical protein
MIARRGTPPQTAQIMMQARRRSANFSPYSASAMGVDIGVDWDWQEIRSQERK